MRFELTSRRIDYLFFLVSLHVILLTVCFLEFYERYVNALRIAVGDCELALAMLLAVCTPVRFGLRLAIASFLVLAAALLHYVAVNPMVHPYNVDAEQNLLPFFLAAVLGGAFYLLRRSQGGRIQRDVFTAQQSAQQPSQRITLSLVDLFLWMLIIGVSIVLVKQAFALADMDLWQSLDFAIWNAPIRVLKRLPLLVLALLFYGLMWTLISRILLTQHWTWRQLLHLVCLFVVFTVGEALITTGYLFFEWPLPCPVAMLKNLHLIQRLGLWFTAGYEVALQSFLDVALVPPFRFLIFGGSLVLVRLAGWRLPEEQAPVVES